MSRRDFVPASEVEVLWNVSRRIGPAWKWLLADLQLLGLKDSIDNRELLHCFSKLLKLLGARLLPDKKKQCQDPDFRAKTEVQELAMILATISDTPSEVTPANAVPPNIDLHPTVSSSMDQLAESVGQMHDRLNALETLLMEAPVEHFNKIGSAIAAITSPTTDCQSKHDQSIRTEIPQVRMSGTDDGAPLGDDRSVDVSVCEASCDDSASFRDIGIMTSRVPKRSLGLQSDIKVFSRVFDLSSQTELSGEALEMEKPCELAAPVTPRRVTHSCEEFVIATPPKVKLPPHTNTICDQRLLSKAPVSQAEVDEGSNLAQQYGVGPQVHLGTIDNFVFDKGFGFISQDVKNGERSSTVFFHITELKSAFWLNSPPEKGHKVRFQIRTSSKGCQAYDIRLAEGHHELHPGESPFNAWRKGGNGSH